MTCVSVVMSVYNDERFLREAIESILNQTFSDYEFIIIDDGSTDGSSEIISEYNDSRIFYIRQGNHGLPYALNKGIGMSKGKYVARMDADDISHPQRLEKQYNYMENHPDVFLCGTAMQRFGYKKYYSGYYSNVEEVKIRTFVCNPVGHPTWFFKNDSNYRIHYDETFIKSQDYEVMIRLVMDKVRMAILEEPLLFYRERKRSAETIEKKYTSKARKRFLSLLGIETTDEIVELIIGFLEDKVISEEDKAQVENVLLSIINRNKDLKIFDQYYLEKYFYDRGIYG